LDTVDKDKTVLRGDELEVDSVDNWPDFPGPLASSKQVVLDLVSDGCHGVSINQTQVCEENSHENWAPKDLIDGNLHKDVLSVGSRNLAVQPIVEVMARWSVVEKTEGREGDEALHVERSTRNEDLYQKGNGSELILSVDWHLNEFQI
jgi:hypothetical protein